VVFVRKPWLLYLIVFLFIQLTLCLAGWKFVQAGTIDFRNFYADGHLVRTGETGRLYDYDAQTEVQNRLVSPRAAALPLMTPPVVALAFAPLSRLSYLWAFRLFAVINLLLAITAAAWVGRTFKGLSAYAPITPVLLFLGFLPLGFALMQGQLSVILLAVYCAAFLALERKRYFVAGLVLSLGLIKLQITLPVAVLFLLWRRWRFVAGFAIGGSIFVLASVATVGFLHMKDIWRSMFGVSILPTYVERVRYGISPDRMPNLYGLMYMLFGGGRASIFLTLFVSALLVIWAARQRCSLVLAILVGLLTSYHLYLHDLTLLLLPSAFLLDRYLDASQTSSSDDPPQSRMALYATAALLLLPLLSVFLLTTSWISLLCLPMLLAAVALGVGQSAPRPTRAEVRLRTASPHIPLDLASGED
jgi:hypothetical protein